MKSITELFIGELHVLAFILLSAAFAFMGNVSEAGYLATGLMGYLFGKAKNGNSGSPLTPLQNPCTTGGVVHKSRSDSAQ